MFKSKIKNKKYFPHVTVHYSKMHWATSDSFSKWVTYSQHSYYSQLRREKTMKKLRCWGNPRELFQAKPFQAKPTGIFSSYIGHV